MKNPNQIAARPTVYAGTRFRSRLEARWAAFFDFAGWSWEYEPVDLNGWSPDFYLHGPGQPTPVEVKPIDWPGIGSDFTYHEIVEGRADLQKVRDVVGTEILILGSYPPPITRLYDGIGLGALYESARGDDGRIECGVDNALIFAGVGMPIDFSAEFGAWFLRISGDTGKTALQPVAPALVEQFWREAGNRTQWRGR